jgi:hypothetical protein
MYDHTRLIWKTRCAALDIITWSTRNSQVHTARRSMATRRLSVMEEALKRGRADRARNKEKRRRNGREGRMQIW